MKKWIFILTILMMPSLATSGPTFRVEAGHDYSRYTNRELRRRVWRLERAVAQLQDQVFRMAMERGNPSPVPIYNTVWNCHIQAFSDTFISSGYSKFEAQAKVIKKCSDKHGAIFCSEDKSRCGNS